MSVAASGSRGMPTRSQEGATTSLTMIIRYPVQQYISMHVYNHCAATTVSKRCQPFQRDVSCCFSLRLSSCYPSIDYLGYCTCRLAENDAQTDLSLAFVLECYSILSKNMLLREYYTTRLRRRHGGWTISATVGESRISHSA